MTTTPPEPQLVRFDAAVRFIHWSAAVLFAVTASTAAGLYLPGVAAAVGRRNLLRDIHVVAGLLLLGPLAATIVGPGRHEARALSRWQAGDGRWLRTRGRLAAPGKFNAGQKLFAALVAGAIPAMALTGSVMRWFEPFPLAWRTGSTFVHDWLALGLIGAATSPSRWPTRAPWRAWSRVRCGSLGLERTRAGSPRSPNRFLRMCRSILQAPADPVWWWSPW